MKPSFLPRLAALVASCLPMVLHAPVASAADSATTAVAAVAAPTARIIVKLKSDSPLRRMQAQSVNERHSSQAQAMGERVGRTMTAGSGIDERTQVMFASGISSEELAARVAKEADVEYAVVDRRQRRFAVPNDPLYTTVGGNGPASGQWYLRAPDTTIKSSINAEAAWNITTGSNSVVVADLDTGVRFEHPDLKTVGAGGNLLAGYDMIADVAGANDGDGRDADPSDPGDWITAAEDASGTFKGCGAESSSWHGTQTAALIGALTNNGIGMASVGRNVRVLPVRVLGKCGGFDSDITAGMRWAAGLAVPGVPTNPTPARVINMSLGSSSACGVYGPVVNELLAIGVTVVVSAGNDAGHAVTVPANCPGVIAVAGLRHAGTKVGFSDLGPEVTISAPAGNCVNTGANDACLYPILTAANSGTTVPVSSIYTDAFNASLGTSFSAPLVAGTIGLMLSAQPALTPAQIKSTLQSTARVFPTTGSTNSDGTAVLACTAPQTNSAGQPVDQLECYCTTSTCGAGMLDAGAALLSAANVVAKITNTTGNSVTAGTNVALTATTQLAAGRSVASYQWSVISGGSSGAFSGATNAATATLATTAPGTVTVQLVVTDNLGSVSTVTSTITVTAPVPVVPTARITTSANSVAAGQSISLSGITSTATTGRTIASYQWSITSGATFATISDVTSPTATLAGTAAGNVTVQLVVTDNQGATSTASATVTVTAATPVAARITTAASSVVAGQSVSLSGSTSTPTSGRTITSYQWSLTAGGSSGTLATASGATVTLNTTAAGNVTVQLVVTDSLNATSTTSTTITVTATSTGGTSTPAPDTGGGGGGGGALGLGWLLALAAASLGVRGKRRA